jgi:hypothetical protein
VQPSLNYHPATPTRLPRIRRSWIVIAVVLLGILGARILVPAAFARIRLLRLQKECLRLNPGPEQPVLDFRPAALPLLGRSDRAFINGSVGTLQFVGYLPAAFQQYSSMRGARSRAIALIFCHSRRSPAGHERIVAIEAIPTHGSGLHLLNTVYRPVNLFDRSPDRYAQVSSYRYAEDIIIDTSTVIYPGRADPSDASRFTLPIRTRTGAIDLKFQLRDDDEIMMLTPPSPPSTASSRLLVPPASPGQSPAAR